MDRTESLSSLLRSPEPFLMLAPMQDITDLPFWTLLSSYDGADLYCTEYFRVLPDSHLSKRILSSITRNPTGRPALAQMIGNDIPALVRTARELQQHPVAGIDLNLGCPVPVVYRKCAGGGLLRDPQRIDRILGALRETIEVPFSVKTRIGFDDPSAFDELLTVFSKHSLDLVTVHGRTVKELYGPHVHYDLIARAVTELPCPVVANGNVFSLKDADQVLKRTGARGLMVGRGAVRNPWIFRQIREFRSGSPIFTPSGRDVLQYVAELYRTTCPTAANEGQQVQKMKKYMNYIAPGLSRDDAFLHSIRRATSRAEFFRICEEYLNHADPAFQSFVSSPAIA